MTSHLPSFISPIIAILVVSIGFLAFMYVDLLLLLHIYTRCRLLFGVVHYFGILTYLIPENYTRSVLNKPKLLTLIWSIQNISLPWSTYIRVSVFYVPLERHPTKDSKFYVPKYHWIWQLTNIICKQIRHQ